MMLLVVLWKELAHGHAVHCICWPIIRFMPDLGRCQLHFAICLCYQQPQSRTVRGISRGLDDMGCGNMRATRAGGGETKLAQTPTFVGGLADQRRFCRVLAAHRACGGP